MFKFFKNKAQQKIGNSEIINDAMIDAKKARELSEEGLIKSFNEILEEIKKASAAGYSLLTIGGKYFIYLDTLTYWKVLDINKYNSITNKLIEKGFSIDNITDEDLKKIEDDYKEKNDWYSYVDSKYKIIIKWLIDKK